MRGDRGLGAGVTGSGVAPEASGGDPDVVGALAELVTRHELFLQHDDVVRVPHLVRGRLVVPPRIPRQRVVAAFMAAGPDVRYIRLEGAQVLAERTVGGGTRYLVLPAVDPLDLVTYDIATLARGPYAVPLDDVLGLADQLGQVLAGSPDTLLAVLDTMRASAPYPEEFVATEVAALASTMDTAVLRDLVDRELGAWGRPGGEFLDGWVTLPATPLPEPHAALSEEVARRLDVAHHRGEAVTRYAMRAAPTRQLHITAGNTPASVALSLLRLLLTKGVGVVKLPSGGYGGAVLPGALIAAALSVADAASQAGLPHPLLRHLSVVYWPGGDPVVEAALLAPEAFDRIVVWGDVAAVASVRARAPLSRVVSFDPRYGVSLVDATALTDDSVLRDVAARAAADVCHHDQKACDASHVQYVIGSAAAVARYGEALRQALAAWDDTAAPVPLPGTDGQITRLRRGRLALADWLVNSVDGGWRSGVAVSEAAFDVLEHPLARLAVLRPVAEPADALAALSRHVATLGVWPESLRTEVRDEAAARGVAQIVPLGHAGQSVPGGPHDGMLVLHQLVEWVRG